MGFLEELMARSGMGLPDHNEDPQGPQTPASPDMGGVSPTVNQGLSSANPASPDMGGDSPLTSFNQNASVPPQKTSRIKSMLTNFALGMGEGMMHSAGVETPAQAATRQATTAHTAALTQQVQQQTDAMKDSVEIQTPNGVMRIPGYMAKSPAFAAAIKGQYGLETTDRNNDVKSQLGAINAELKARGMGITIGVGADGKPTFTNQTPDQLSAPVAAKAKGSGASGKVDPIIYAQIGPSPDPTTNPNGARRWGQMAEAIKTRMATDPKVAGYKALVYGRAATTPFSTTDADGNPTTISNLQAINTGAVGINKQNLGTTMGKAALIGDIKGGVEQVRQYAKVFDNSVSRKQLAAVLAAPGVTAQTFLQQPIAESMDDDTAQAAIALLNLKENAMAMRSVLGAGQGSEDLRKAIQQTIPNGLTPNSKYAGHQLDTFLGTLGRLEKGIPNLGAATSNALGNGVVKWEKGPDGKPHKVTQ